MLSSKHSQVSFHFIVSFLSFLVLIIIFYCLTNRSKLSVRDCLFSGFGLLTLEALEAHIHWAHIHWAADVSPALLFLQQEVLGISDDTAAKYKPLKLFLNLIPEANSFAEGTNL